MTGKARLALQAVAICSMAATPAIASERLPSTLAQLTPGDFASKVRIIDDPLEPAVVLSSQDAYKRARSVNGARARDIHLQAVVDRASGRVSWRVWHELSMPHGRKLGSVEYASGGGGLEQSSFLTLESWLDQCPPTDGIGSCNHVVRVAFELPDHAVREIAAAYRPGERTAWHLRFKEADGRDITSGLAPAEAAGLILALERWRQVGA